MSVWHKCYVAIARLRTLLSMQHFLTFVALGNNASVHNAIANIMACITNVNLIAVSIVPLCRVFPVEGFGSKTQVSRVTKLPEQFRRRPSFAGPIYSNNLHGIALYLRERIALDVATHPCALPVVDPNPKPLLMILQAPTSKSLTPKPC